MREPRSSHGRFIRVAGRRIFTDTRGAGEPVVVFESALAGSSVSWTFVQPAVSAFARTFAYDRAGFGASDRGSLPRTAGRVADELRAVLEAAGEPPPYILVGHSFGGLVMRIFAARYPQLTAALVLVDPAHPEDWLTPAPKEQARIDRGAQLCRHGYRASRLGIAHLVSGLVGLGALRAAKALVDLVSRGGIGGDADWLLAPMFKLPIEAQRRLRAFWTRPAFYEALGSQIESMPVSAQETLVAAAGSYGDLPLVTISSTRIGEHRHRQQEALATLSTRGRHLIASNSGHWIPLDQPDLVTHVIRDVRQETMRPRAEDGDHAAIASTQTAHAGH
jgi:pimeloyl-ACP methyl ester carboxylesterase